MKVTELREMNQLELNAKLIENLDALQNLKFQDFYSGRRKVQNPQISRFVTHG